MKRIVLSLCVIAAVAVMVVGATTAYFSDTETSEGNLIQVGSLDLTVNGYDDPELGPVVTLEDLKPCQTFYSDEITLHVHNNPGKLYKMIEPAMCETNGVTEPEAEAEVAGPVDYLPEVTWFDLEVWNPQTQEWEIIIPDGEVTVDQIAGQWIYLGTYGEAMQENEVTIRQSFHMMAEAGNEYQSDSCLFAEQFMVTQTNAPHPDDVYVPGGIVLDSCDLGEESSMLAHNALGWFPDPGNGNYGGRDGGSTIAMIGGDDDDNGVCDLPGEEDATFEVNAGSDVATTLVVRHLDGSANDSFDIYVDGVLVGNYVGNQFPGETWTTTNFALGASSFTGTATVRFVMTDYPWSGCPTWGQGAINWVKAVK